VLKGKKWQKETFKEVPQVCPNKKKGAKERFKRSPFESMQKEKSKKKGSQIKFKRNSH
jgi:hypothetical protein